MNMQQENLSAICEIILASLARLELDQDLTLETVIYGNSSHLESIEIVTVLAEIEDEIDKSMLKVVDVFQILLENQDVDVTVRALGLLILRSAHGL